MANKKLSPQSWFEKEEGLKKEFLEQMLIKGELISDQEWSSTIQNRYLFSNQSPPLIATPPLMKIVINSFLNLPQATLQLDEFQFEKLKKDYRSFKFNKKNKTEKRVKLQVYINQKTYDMLEKLKSEFGYESIDNCLKTLIDGNSTDIKKIKEKNDQLRKELEEQRQLTVQIKQHQNELIENNNILRIRAEHFAKALNTYLGTELFEKLSYHLQYVLTNFISTDQYKNSEFESLSQLIIEELKPKILYDLKMNKFINDEQ
ncbi:hypothetical protein [Acinetobacter venetianus]|uniref:hypothetical protein n=1 Tax=Acinetobacter venetianus TaxID=52133 RepID=UPI0035BE1CEA